MKTDNEILDFTVNLARQAGDILLSYFGGTLTRTIKSHAEDFATEADFSAEKLILGAIKEHFPDDSILAEESGSQTGTSDYTWIVDPLDGTRNFANGKDEWGTMIARARGDVVILSVVLNAYKKTLGTALRGGGAFLNGQQVVIEPSLDLQEIESTIRELPAVSLTQRATILRDRLQLRGIELSRGSAAGIGLEALSSTHNLRISVPPGKTWDHAPISLLLAEAGLLVTNFVGEPYVWHRDVDGYLAATPELHAKVLLLLRG